MISTNQAAKRLGLAVSTLSRYMASGKVPAPKTVMAGRLAVHDWTEEDIEHVRRLLPKIANGRKTRWQKNARRKRKQSAKKKKSN